MLQTEVNEKRHGKWRDESLSVEREKRQIQLLECTF